MYLYLASGGNVVEHWPNNLGVCFPVPTGNYGKLVFYAPSPPHLTWIRHPCELLIWNHSLPDWQISCTFQSRCVDYYSSGIGAQDWGASQISHGDKQWVVKRKKQQEGEMQASAGTSPTLGIVPTNVRWRKTISGRKS